MSQDPPDPAATTALGLGAGVVLLGQYELERRLGAGGMGEVWLARDQHLDRLVAAKLLPPVLATSARAASALRSEAAQAIELGHRAIGRVYHYGLHDQTPVLVMEFIEGESLAQYLDAHRQLEPVRVVELLTPLADALDYAHEQRVVHRDLKPANIMLRPDGSPVLMDFGLAAEARDQSSIQGKTGEAEISGTLVYMSPEQLKGKRPRKEMDLYSLAATAYEMLCGNPPFFRGDTAALYQQIIHEPVEPIGRWGSAVDAVLVRALAKDPGDRFPSAVAFVEALRAAAAGVVGPVAGPQGADLPSAVADTVVDAVPPTEKATATASQAQTRVHDAPPASAGAATVTSMVAPEKPARRGWFVAVALAAMVGMAGAVLTDHYASLTGRGGPPAPDFAHREYPMAQIGRFDYENPGDPKVPGSMVLGFGTGVVVDLEGESVALTALHLVKPATGLQRQLDVLGTLPIMSQAYLRRSEVQDRLTQLILFPGASAVSGVHEDPLDVIGFYLGSKKGGLRLADGEPPDGAWLAVVMHDGTAYPARHRLADGWPARTYVFEGAVPPPGSSGAPVLDEQDRVVGLHLANFEHDGQQHGMCTRGDRILYELRPALSASMKSGRSGPPPIESPEPTRRRKMRYQPFE